MELDIQYFVLAFHLFFTENRTVPKTGRVNTRFQVQRSSTVSSSGQITPA